MIALEAPAGFPGLLAEEAECLMSLKFNYPWSLVFVSTYQSSNKHFAHRTLLILADIAADRKGDRD